MRSRAAIVRRGLRARPVEEKTAICAAVVEHVWPLVADGRIRTMVNATFPLEEAAAAHALMEERRPHRQDRARRLPVVSTS